MKKLFEHLTTHSNTPISSQGQIKESPQLKMHLKMPGNSYKLAINKFLNLPVPILKKKETRGRTKTTEKSEKSV